MKHGIGVEKFSEKNEEYFGEYQGGKFDGIGIYRYKDGTYYKGRWKMGMPEKS